MKDKVSREEFAAAQDDYDNDEVVSTSFDTITPPCDACGEENVGMGAPVMMAIPGMLFPSREYDVPVFVPDPDVQLRIIAMPNGAIGFVTDETKTKYQHEECYQLAIDNLAYDVEDDDDEEE